jgi:hypothetical protein
MDRSEQIRTHVDHGTISRPPALAPSIRRRSLEVHFSRIRYSAESMKSVNVFLFFISLPSSCHSSPISRQFRIYDLTVLYSHRNYLNLPTPVPVISPVASDARFTLRCGPPNSEDIHKQSVYTCSEHTVGR